MNLIGRLFALVVVCSPTLLQSQQASDPYAELEGRVIQNVVVETDDVFDTSKEDESSFVFRMANRFHIDTRRATVVSQLLFKPGEKLSPQKVAESERTLRTNPYLFDASITPIENDDGTVDVLVKTRDNWTLFPEFTFSNAGGESETSFGIEEQNLLGTGTRLNVSREDDRERTSSVFEISSENIGRHRISAAYSFSDLSDGQSQFIDVQRPFFSFDTKWAAGASLFGDERIDTLYSVGEPAVRYLRDQEFFRGFAGLSDGLVNGWVTRWSVGYIFDNREFDPVFEEGLIPITPEDRRLSYPFVQYQRIQDKFVETRNLNQILQTEDISLGTSYQLSLGVVAESFDADRNALILEGGYRRGFGSPERALWLLSTDLSTRVESGTLTNTVLSSSLEFYKRQSEKRVFFAAMRARFGDDLDLDNFSPVGGETGLRGFPLNFLNAESTALVTVEQRFYTDYYPFKLFRVGAAAFFDAAYGIGADPVGFESDRLRSNVGVGLRFSSTRSSSNRIFHLNIAAPTTGADGVDDVQIQFFGQQRF